jgi:glutamate racemase
MKNESTLFKRNLRLVVTDSGLGGLSVCAPLERAFAASPRHHRVRLTYVNVWPDERFGYNQMPDVATRVQVFEQALAALAALHPDAIVIACNTLSILYGLTGFSRTNTVPVFGIIDAGVTLFHEALVASPDSAILLLGTKTTIESGVHRQKLLDKGIAAERIVPVACHGLAAAIENDPEGSGVGEMIAQCLSAVSDARPSARSLYAGLCCTHYGYAAVAIRVGLEWATGRVVDLLDPSARLVSQLVPDAPDHAGDAHAAAVSVEVISKVPLSQKKCLAIGRLIDHISPATAQALLSYSRVPELF